MLYSVSPRALTARAPSVDASLRIAMYRPRPVGGLAQSDPRPAITITLDADLCGVAAFTRRLIGTACAV